MPIALLTQQGEALLHAQEQPWSIYPRPQMKRDSYLSLNGTWDFTVHDSYPQKYDRTITVPFCPECALSGIGEHFPEGSALYYRRSFTLPEGFCKDRVLLHIGAADQITEVYINGSKVGGNRGGYNNFTLDITPVLQEENEIVICCVDNLHDLSFPYGKQVLPEKRGGMWYTPVSGIWQSVWLESVPESYIERLHIENRGYSVAISIEPALQGKVTVAGLGEFPLENGSVTITPDDPRLWSPEDPYLYDFTLQTARDQIDSYFAIRSLDIQTVDGLPRLCLNGKPYFFHGLLDQGYWPDGIYTPAKPECYAEDILAMKRLGFNMLRKHIKVEPEEFYYQCDKLGMVVFQDMVNNGQYHYWRDTALTTVFRFTQIRSDKHFHTDPKLRHMFRTSMTRIVRQLKNHPSICYWTIFNEGWGQFNSDTVYEEFRLLDDTRFIDSTSGWFRRKKTDVDSRHVYFRKVELKAKDKPLVLSEFGGYSFKPEGHVFNTEDTYGYGKYENREAFQADLEKLYLEQVVPCVKQGLCAAVYTQVSDVEDETNGLLSYDRKVCKVDAPVMQNIAKKLKI